MVKKLLKYEAQYYMRSMMPIALILLGMSIINRIIQIFESDSKTYDILFTSSSIILGIVCVTCIIMSVVFLISRFYKNLFTDEGYLTLVLPVTENKHIFGKLIAGVGNMIFAVILVVIAIMIATSGEMLVELFKAAKYIGNWIKGEVGTANYVFYIIELAVLILASLISGALLFYSCASLGQLAKKNRVAGAFGIYFIYYLITQVIGTALVIIFSTHPEILDPLAEWASKNPYTAIHVILCAGILFCLVLGLIFFLITRHVLKNKLNLE